MATEGDPVERVTIGRWTRTGSGSANPDTTSTWTNSNEAFQPLGRIHGCWMPPLNHIHRNVIIRVNWSWISKMNQLHWMWLIQYETKLSEYKMKRPVADISSPLSRWGLPRPRTWGTSAPLRNRWNPGCNTPTIIEFTFIHETVLNSSEIPFVSKVEFWKSILLQRYRCCSFVPQSLQKTGWRWPARSDPATPSRTVAAGISISAAARAHPRVSAEIEGLGIPDCFPDY